METMDIAISAQKTAPPDMAMNLAATINAWTAPRSDTPCGANWFSTGSSMASSSWGWRVLLDVPGADRSRLFDQQRTVQSLRCHLATSSSLTAGTSSQVAMAPSTTPLLMASVICAGGMFTGAPPNAVSSLAALREGLRSLTPLKLSRPTMGFDDVLKITPVPLN